MIDNRYHELFKCHADIVREFETDAVPPDSAIILAVYECADYEGDALVIYTGRDGQLYEVNASHCSCYGLEGQWRPELTSWSAIAMRPLTHYPEAARKMVRMLAEAAGVKS